MMTPSLWQTVRAGLVMPLAIVVVLGAALGFVAGRRVYGDQTPARVSTITTRGSVAPIATLAPESTPEPTTEATPQTGGGSGTSRTGRSCPAGCECEFPPGGVQIVCRGNRS